MTEREQVCTAMSVGAVLGAIAAYLFFTDPGRALRQQMLPKLDELESELDHFRNAVARTSSIASEGWKMLNPLQGR